MMSDIIKLEIVYENCDYTTIQRKDIFGLQLTEIQKSMVLISNALVISDKPRWSRLSLKWDFVKDIVEESGFGTSLEKHIFHKHITDYYLHLADGNEVKITLPWSGENEHNNNLCEHHEFSENKNYGKILTIIHEKL